MARNELAVIGHIGPFSELRSAMSAPHALAALAALGQQTRLEIFRLLMRSEPDGLSAGAIAESLCCPQNTLSTHLSVLARAGLVRGTRDGRSIIYRAEIASVRALVEFVVKDCCDGHPDLCGLPVDGGNDCGCKPARKPSKRRPRR